MYCHGCSRNQSSTSMLFFYIFTCPLPPPFFFIFHISPRFLFYSIFSPDFLTFIPHFFHFSFFIFRSHFFSTFSILSSFFHFSFFIFRSHFFSTFSLLSPFVISFLTFFLTSSLFFSFYPHCISYFFFSPTSSLFLDFSLTASLLFSLFPLFSAIHFSPHFYSSVPLFRTSTVYSTFHCIPTSFLLFNFSLRFISTLPYSLISYLCCVLPVSPSITP